MPHSPFLSILGVGLIGFSLYIGLIVSNFQGMGANVQSNFLFHNIGVIVSCLILYFLAKRKIHHKYLSFFIAIAAAFCILLPFLAGESIGIPFQGLGALVVASRAVFAAVGFLLLYSTVPAGREGFFIALVLAAYDLLWTLLSPLLGLVSHMTYLYYICCWMVGVAGILFAATNKQELPQDTSAVSRQTLQLFGLIFLSALCGFLLIGIMLDAPVVVGLLLDVSQPKFSIQLQPTGALYIALLLCFPLAGRLLDRRPDRAIIMCIAAVATVTILKLINIDSKLLGYLLDLVRLFFWISAQTIVAKLFRGRMVLILLIIAVYLLLPMQFVGVALRSVPLIAPLVAAVVIICLFFARRQLLAT
ncbi:MAG: hypothetical protein LBV04_09180, partial [Deferribacteraceae bacterium]|nr:hypothetical protein [Deferribacteraceae bacterium]